MTARRVLVWRHGRTTWNAERRFQGQSDPALDEVGRAQAAQASSLLATLAPQLIVSSDLQRAVQTAQALAMVTGLAPVYDKRLRERSLGHWEGLTRDEVAERYPRELEDWVAGRDVRSRGGESREQVAARAGAAFAELPDVETVVLVTHSATALALTSQVLGLSQRVHILGPLANCHWSELRAEPAGWRLRAHNAGPPGLVIPVPATEEEFPDASAIDGEEHFAGSSAAGAAARADAAATAMDAQA